MLSSGTIWNLFSRKKVWNLLAFLGNDIEINSFLKDKLDLL